MITCSSGVAIRMKVVNIREAGRATQGVKLINIDEGDQIAAIARIPSQEDDADHSEHTDESTQDGEANAESNPEVAE